MPNSTRLRQIDWELSHLIGVSGRIFNVRDYNATGNGVADDTAEIQAAVTACADAGGGIVYFPPGTYRISATINITASNIHLLGAGSASVIDNGNATTHIFAIRGSVGANSALTINSLVGTSTITVANGALFAAGNWVIIQDNVFAEVHEISSVVGNIVTLREQVLYDWTVANAANLYILNPRLNNSVSRMQLINGIGGSAHGIMVDRAAYFSCSEVYFNVPGRGIQVEGGDLARSAITSCIFDRTDIGFYGSLGTVENRVTNNLFVNASSQGVLIERGAYNIVANNISVNPVAQHFQLQSGRGNTISGNICNGGGGDAISLTNSANPRPLCQYNKVTNNHILYPAGDGINLNRGVALDSLDDNVISNNIIVCPPIGANGIICSDATRLVITGNHCTGALDAGGVGASGIALAGGANDCIVTGNRCYNNRNGIRLDTPANNLITGNNVRGNTLNNILLTALGPGNRITNNLGFATESLGTATIPNTATSVVVTHNLAVTPVAANISVTPTNNPTNDPGNLYVDTITATQFTIRCRNDPGASGLNLSWQVIEV